VTLGVGLLVGGSPARANLDAGLLKLVSGKADCQGKRFAAGVKKILEAAVEIQQAAPNHAATKQWLPEVQGCLRAWMQDAGKRCDQEGKVDAYEELLEIQKQIKYLNVPQVKKALPARQTACVKSIVKLAVKECETSAGQKALAQLERIKDRLTKLGVEAALLTGLDTGQSTCAQKWIVEAESRCRSAATVDVLKEIGGAVPRVMAAHRPRALLAYEACVRSLGQLGYATCQARRFVEGRTLLKEAISRFGFFALKDRKLLAQMQKDWLPRCGAFVLQGQVSATATVAGTAFQIEAKVQLEVGRTGSGNTLVGEMRTTYLAVKGVRQGCRVLITPTDGRYSLTGSENLAARTASVMPDAGMPQTEAYEDVQLMCGEATPKLSKTKLLHAIMKRAGLFAIQAKAVHSARMPYAWRGTLETGEKATLSGALTYLPME
jgi:hypothetical protein